MGSGLSGLYIRTHGSLSAINALDNKYGARIIPGSDGIVTGGSSSALGKNLMKSMGVSEHQKWTGYQAHHLIPKELANHPVIAKIGMELDDASNGIFLRIPGENISTRSRHRGYHSVYSKFVKYELDKFNPHSNVHSLQIQVYALQLKLRHLLQSGLPMYESSGATLELWERYIEKLQ